MEFEEVGAHCQYEGCKQKDFLPFKCDACGKSLCLMHRSYVTHDCVAGQAKDMTSMDCPICSKSVRFDKSQDVNLVWEEHYLNSCTQQPAQQKEIVRCFKPECRTVLGPSNTYTCNKCHQRVCLAHRIAEEHSCVGNVRLDFLNRVQKDMTVGNADRAKKDTKKHDHPVSMFLPHGSKAKKAPVNKAHAPGSAHSSSRHECPFCSLAHESNVALLDHIMAFHPEDNANNNRTTTHASSSSASTTGSATGISSIFSFPSLGTATATTNIHDNNNNTNNNNTTTNNSNNSNNSNTGAATSREVCPICHARFPDAIHLVRHFESAHSEHAINQQQTEPGAQGKCLIS
eukprot:CAMPEP_0170396444 /NCGR_PEP_ID=MMETSP0117_2-20130122/22328_1 /TAXON_ID=400756 /ORGANISM="Durinskia baltica, Strain CSIRO CS-38" /LENGTH=343 /DNA_ID=CAMNT_0010652847 /DNA_START=225 /DNA_END=1256 /DNA_ORIENTATION=-